MPNLPPNWKADPTLAGVIPSTHDHRTFARFPENPERYAVCINGGGVYDVQDGRFLTPQVDRDSNRVRFIFNRCNPARGQRSSQVKPYYARVIATIVHGPKGLDFEAHHRDEIRTHDRWDNIHWLTAGANRRLSAEKTDRSGTKNPNAKLSPSDLEDLVRTYDGERRSFGADGIRHLAAQLAARFGIDAVQVRRIVNGTSWSQDVQKIRRKLLAESQYDSME